jgi:hypothetical protein
MVKTLSPEALSNQPAGSSASEMGQVSFRFFQVATGCLILKEVRPTLGLLVVRIEDEISVIVAALSLCQQ